MVREAEIEKTKSQQSLFDTDFKYGENNYEWQDNISRKKLFY